MHDMTDARLEGLLRRTLHEEADRAPLVLTAEILAERARARPSRARRRTLTLLALAAALLVPMSGLLLAGALRVTPAEDHGGSGAYQAILVREVSSSVGGGAARSEPATIDLQVIAVRSDGAERLVATLPGTLVTDERQLRASRATVSRTGWLAVWAGRQARRSFGEPPGFQVATADLHDPVATARVISADVGSGGGVEAMGWGPDGTLALMLVDDDVRLIDPATGGLRILPFSRGGGDSVDRRIVWTADGTGLVRAPNGYWRLVYADGADASPVFDVVSIDGGATKSGASASFDPYAFSPTYGPDGMVLQVCDTLMQAGCPDLPDGSVVAGPDQVIYEDGPSDPIRVIDAALTSAGHPWILTERWAGQPVDAPPRGAPRGRVWDIRPIDRPVGGPDPLTAPIASFAVPGEVRSGSIAGFAPDESMVAIEATADGGATNTYVAQNPGTDQLAALHEGSLAGFLPAEVADGIGTQDGWVIPEGSLLAGAAPALPSIADVTTLMHGRRVTDAAHEAEFDYLTNEQSIDLAIEGLDSGMEVGLACLGPTDVVVTTDLPGFPPLVDRCLSGEIVSTALGDLAIDRPVRVTVTTDPSVAWRVVVVDPTP